MHYNTAWRGLAAKASDTWVSISCRACCNPVENKVELLYLLWVSKKAKKNTHIRSLLKAKWNDGFKQKLSVMPGAFCILLFQRCVKAFHHPVIFIVNVCFFCRFSFPPWLCSSRAVRINSDISEGTGNPCGSPRGESVQTPLTPERGSVHPRVIT